MKMLNVIDEPTQYPQFWTEEWLKIALHELDTRYMTPEKRAAFEIIVANNAYAVRLENERVAKAEAAAKIKGMAEGKAESNITFARLMKLNGEPIEKIKTYTGLNEDEINAL